MHTTTEFILNLCEQALKTRSWWAITAKLDDESYIQESKPFIRNNLMGLSQVAKLKHAATAEAFMKNVAAWNRLGYGIHFGNTLKRRLPEGKRSTREETLYLTHMWLDVDDGDPQENAERVITGELEPTYVVHSGGGIHAYYKLKTMVTVDSERLRDYERTLEGLALSFGGDLNCRELSRTLRLPGTVNMKPKRNGALARIIYQSDATHEYEAFEERYFGLGADRTPKPFARCENASDEMPRYLAEYLSTPQASGERNARMFSMATFALKADFFNEQDFYARGLADGMSEFEIRNVLASACRTVGV